MSRVATGLGDLGLVAGNRVVLSTANRPEFVTAYLAVLRAHLVAVPVNPRATTGELVRTVADCRPRLIIADSTTVTAARSVVTGVEEALRGADEELRARSAVPRIVALDCAPVAGEEDWTAVGVDAAEAGAAGPRPRVAGGAALHVRHVVGAAGGDAEPPGAAREHRAGGAGAAADGGARGRGVRRPADVPRLRAQRGPRAGAAPAGDPRGRRQLRPRGRTRRHQAARRDRGPRRTAGAGALALGARPRRPAGGRPHPDVRLGAALSRAGRRVHRGQRGDRAPGLRAHGGGAGGDVHPVQRAR